MVIERTPEGILIKTTVPTDTKSVQKLIDYFNVMETVSQNGGTEEEAAELAKQSKKGWWKANKSRFIK